MVLELNGIPVPCRRIHDRSLRNAIRITAVQRAPKHHLALVRAIHLGTSPAGSLPDTTLGPVNFHYIIIRADFVEMAALCPEAHPPLGCTHNYARLPYYGRPVRREFRQFEVPVAIHHEQAVAVEQEARVVEEIIVKNGTLPRAVHQVRSPVHVALLLVVGDKQRIIHALVIAQGRSPLAGAIGIFPVPEVVNVIVLQQVVNITDDAPVHQVPRVHDGSAGTEKHSGAYHIIIFSHPDDIVVRNVRIG